VYIFSGPKTQDEPIPEFSDILEKIKDIKQEIAEFGQTTKDKMTFYKLIKRLDALEQSVYLHGRLINQLEQALMTAASAKLTEKQRKILHWLTTRYQQDEVYTNLIKQLSEELGIPESTVRWNLRGLRDAELIYAGTKDNKGVPVQLTTMGKIMASYANPL